MSLSTAANSSAQDASKDTAQVRRHTDMFIMILEAAAANGVQLADACSAGPIGVQPVRPGATQEDIDKLGTLLVRKMPEFIHWGQNGTIDMAQVEKLQDLARTFAPRLARMAQEKRLARLSPLPPRSGRTGI